MTLARPVRFNVGLKRLVRGKRPSIAATTRNARLAFRQIERNLAKVIGAIENATPDALEFALEPIEQRSLVYVPFDTGELTTSLYLETKKTSNGAQAEIGYGRGGVPFYAIFVHELTDMQHEPPTRAKFLQLAVDEHIDEIPDRIREWLRLE